MARKLFIMVALISLVVLVQASSGLADMVLPASYGQDVTWVEYQYGMPLGDSGNVFYAGYPSAYGFSLGGETTWGTGHLANSQSVTPAVNTQTGNTTYTITYDTLVSGTGCNFPKQNISEVPFAVIQNPQGQSQYAIVASFDFTVTTSQTFDSNGNLIVETFFGSGHDFLNNSEYFTLTGTMPAVAYGQLGYADIHRDFFTSDLQLTYGASAVPIPGAIWLLGTGLLGLGCVGRRRKA